ncbi:hypothetical protein ERJ75_000700600 [Trypanosoma vivax]|nr:hypothetical protein ERJ75_000700600 [Trypanosoma vivax]
MSMTREKGIYRRFAELQMEVLQYESRAVLGVAGVDTIRGVFAKQAGTCVEEAHEMLWPGKAAQETKSR